MSNQPLHVNVKGNTPLRIHLKKTKNKSGNSKMKPNKLTPARKPIRKVSMGSKNITDPIRKPSWLTAVKKTRSEETSSNKYKWDSSTALLEINKPSVELNVRDPKFGISRERDVLREANDRMQGHVKDYDTKIRGLVSEVGTLKNETRHLSCQIYQRNLLKSAEIRLEEEKLKREEQEPTPIGVNRHLNCYKEPKDYNPVEERGKKTLAKMWKSAKRAVSMDENDVVTADSNSVTRDDESATEETVLDEDAIESPVQESTRICCKEADCTAALESLGASLIEELETRRDDLQIAKADFDNQQRELHDVVEELEQVDKQRACLLENMHDYRKELSRNMDYFEEKASDGEALPCQLLALELSGNDARKQVAALRDVILRLRHEHPLTVCDVNALNRQRRLLIEKLIRFDVSNKTTRKLILAEEKIVANFSNLRKHIDVLMQKISESNDSNRYLKSQIIETDDLTQQHDAELKDVQKQVCGLEGMSSRYDGITNHLQKHIVEKEMENDQLQQQLQQSRANFEALKLKEKDSSDDFLSDVEEKELRKEVCRQHRRARKAEEAIIKAQQQMEDQDLELKELIAESQDFKLRCIDVANEQSVLEDHADCLKKKVTEGLEANDECCSVENLEHLIQKASEDNFLIKSEMKRCKRSAASAKQRCLLVQDEVTTLLEDLRNGKVQQQRLVDQLQQIPPDGQEGYCMCSTNPNDNDQVMTAESLIELDQLSEVMLEELKDLKPIPAMLRETEVSLQEALRELAISSQKSIEQNKLILGLMQKDARRNEEVEKLNEYVSNLDNKNSTLQSRVHALSDHLENRNSYVQQSKRSSDELELKTQHMRDQLNKSINELNHLKNMLKSVEVDRRSSVEAERNKGVTRDQLDQSRISRLEDQMDRLKSDVRGLTRSKHEFQKKSILQLEDAEQRLARSLVATGSLKENVSNIKTSLTKFVDDDDEEEDFSGPIMTASGAYTY